VRGGQDPAKEIDRLAADTIAFHIKDVAPAGTKFEDGWASVGHGTIDWKALWPHIRKAPKAGVLVVEHDNPSDWRSFAERSFATVKALVA
jgi:sugar phosphate isomerase/epimerase